MSLRNALLNDCPLEGLGKHQESKGIRHGYAAFPYSFRDVRLGQAEVLNESLIRGSFFEGIQIGALHVFDEGELESISVGCLLDYHRDPLYSCDLCRLPAPLTHDQ